MRKKSELSEHQRKLIIFLKRQGKNQKKIAKTVKCSRCAVQTTIKRFEETGSHLNRKRTGRKRATTKREDRKLIRESLKNRKKTSSELAAAFTEKTGTSISARTARRRLVEGGLKGCKARKKPWLSEKNKKFRLKWARRHQQFTQEDWANVVWSDESNFEIFGTPGVSYVRRRVGEEYHPECVVPTVKHGGGSIMIWGCMGASGVGEMFICEGRMNSVRYISVLKDVLQQSYRKIFGDSNLRNIKFQQDNAPCHKSNASMRWMTENEIQLLDWPAQSPDLNPIEHLWSILKTKIRRHNITSRESLKLALKEEWDMISPEKCRQLVASMPKRIAAVIKAKGGATKY